MESLGYQLHNLYCAFEDLFKIVSETFENHIQDKSKYHQELLKRMTISIEGVRPPLPPIAGIQRRIHLCTI
jgi:hypothetical protein